VLERDGHTCQLRGERCIEHATEVDHRGASDDHRMEQLRAVCTPCHRSRTGRQGRAAQPKRAREPEPHPGVIA
jgi:5-methylcytosine-specific restriction protein A